MNTVIQNDFLRVEISPLGAELQSVQTPDGAEYLWQGKAPFWANRAINIFPFVGRLTGGKYTYGGKTYEMGIHGFAWTSPMEVESQTGASAVFLLEDSEQTRASYPFPFAFRVRYALVQNRLDIAFEVKNTGAETMYFGLGGHPGFNVPLEEGKAFSDYYLEFGAPCEPRSVNLSDACFVLEGSEPFPLEGGKRLPLRHSLFDRDAILLEGMDKTVTLAAGGKRSVTVSYPRMDYLALWHNPKTQAPFVCIEPWSALPARQDIVEDLAAYPHFISLAPGGTCQNEWRIGIK